MRTDLLCHGHGHRIWLLTSAAVLFTIPLAAKAQTADTVPPADVADIVVTATRRAELLQDIPISAVAIGQKELERKGASRLEDVLVSVPNVSYSASNSTRMSFLAIRGVLGPEEDPAVGLYVDNVYVGKRAVQSLDFIDPGSVQILRGPQGALYGKNTLGGAVVVENRKPSLNRTEGFVEITGGNYDLVRGKGAVSFPLSENFAVRIAGRADTREGYYRNVVDGSRVGGMDSHGGMASLRYSSGKIDFVLSGDYDVNENDGQILRIQRFTDIGLAAGLPPYPASAFINPSAVAPDPSRPVGAQLPVLVSNDLGDRKVALTRPGFEKRKVYGVTGNLSVELGAVTLRSTTAYRGFTLDSRLGEASGLLGYTQYLAQDQYSQELTLLSNTEGPFSWIVGGSYYYDRFQYDQTPNDLEGRVTGSIGFLGPVPFADITKSVIRTKSAALYAQGKYVLSDHFSVTAGLRYAHDSRKIRKSETVTLFLDTPFATVLPPPFSIPEQTDSLSSEAWLPELAIQYKANENINLYAKASRSYRPAGFVPEPTTPTPNVLRFKKETAWAYEAGIKTSSAGGRLIANLAAFYIDWKGQQITVTNLPFGYLTANEDSHSLGFELDTQFRLSSALQVGASGAWLPEARFDGGDLISTIDIYTATAPLINPKGLRLARAPRYTASAFAEYLIPLAGDADIRLRADVAYKSSERVIQGRSLTSPAYTQVDLRAAYERDGLTFAIWGKNLTNDYFLQYSQGQAGADFTSVSAPRTFGVSLSYRL